jgi:hypothetical protein
MKLFEIYKQNLLLEYIDNNLIYLRDYINASDEDKKKDLPEEFYYYFEDFYEDNLDEILDNYPDFYIENYSDIEGVEQLQNDYIDIYNDFATWLLEKIEKQDLHINDSDYPSWIFFDNAKILKNQWLIHFTDDAIGIAKEGFKYGVYDITKLGLTRHLSKYDKDISGYNFAFTTYDTLNKNYGKEFVMFRASGLRLYHYNDEEYQVIFYGEQAKDIIPIIRGDEYDYSIREKNTYNIIYETDDIENIINWVKNNALQYKNKIIW